MTTSAYTAAFLAALAAGGLVWLAAGQSAEAPPASPPAATQPLDVFYIISPNCEKCKQSAPIVEAAARKYAGRLRLSKLNILDADDLDRILDLEDRLKLPAAAPPRVVVGSRCLTGLDEITGQLDAVLAAQLPPAASQPTSDRQAP